jgi:hypothetical protein
MKRALTNDFVNKAMCRAVGWLTHFQNKGNSARASVLTESEPML